MPPSVSVVPEATHKASRGPLKGVVSALKSPARARVGDEGVAGRNGREKYFPEREGKSMIFLQKGNRKIELAARLSAGTTSSSPLSLLGLADALPAIISDLLHLSGMRPLTQESSKSFCPILRDQKLLGTNKNLYGSSRQVNFCHEKARCFWGHLTCTRG